MDAKKPVLNARERLVQRGLSRQLPTLPGELIAQQLKGSAYAESISALPDLRQTQLLEYVLYDIVIIREMQCIRGYSNG